MKVFSLLLFYSISGLAARAEWKVATVDMSELFSKHPSTLKYNEEATAWKKLIKEDPRAQSLMSKGKEIQTSNAEGKKIIADYQKLTTEAEKKSQSEKIRLIMDKNRNLQQEFTALRQEFIEFEKEQNLFINKEAAKNLRQILQIITTDVSNYAATHGFDAVYDKSGLTNTGLSVIIYAKPGITTDITAEVRKMIIPDAAVEPKQPEQP